MTGSLEKKKIVLILFGIIDSIYLLLENSMQTEFCPLEGCNNNFIVMDINIPALLGLIWFSAYPFLKGKLLSLWQVFALIGVLLLVIYAIITSYYCPFCFFAYLAGISVILIDRKFQK
ncbi:hypothetical protein DRO97_04580 [Archaeoglobales archaeon]|nr:MAG: hypothetical protein DRO97_04580 [Archaeoglobales archaeon]